MSEGERENGRKSTHLATRIARQRKIVELISHHRVHSQSELAKMLSAHGFFVTQATLSRDLVDVGAVKVRGSSDELVYAVPSDGEKKRLTTSLSQEFLDARLGRLCEELLVGAQASGNIVVLRTPPGAAQFLASAIDQSTIPEAIGTIAGDDTVMVVAKETAGGDELAKRFIALASGRQGL